jgi:hypothetical protein
MIQKHHKMTKYVVFTMLFILLATSCRRQVSVKAEQTPAQIEFLTETDQNYGVYHVRDTIYFDFVYKNVGEVPFVINKIEASCGCTRARYSKRPVNPGETDTIRVSYDGNGFLEGTFTKRCDIYSNADTVYHIRINGAFVDSSSD